MQIDHLVHRIDHFELIIFKSGGGMPKSREVIPIYPILQDMLVHSTSVHTICILQSQK